MTIEEKIKFWKSEAIRSLAVAHDLFKSKRYIEALFFGHLALEKLLKAKIIEATNKEPVHSHDLVKLADYAAIKLDEEKIKLLAKINTYNIRTRYQDYKLALYKKATPEFTKNELGKIEQIFNWFSNDTN